MKRKTQYRRWQKVVSWLCAFTVFVTTYALILPAITLETSPDPLLAEAEEDLRPTLEKILEESELRPGEEGFVLPLEDLEAASGKDEIHVSMAGDLAALTAEGKLAEDFAEAAGLLAAENELKEEEARSIALPLFPEEEAAEKAAADNTEEGTNDTAAAAPSEPEEITGAEEGLLYHALAPDPAPPRQADGSNIEGITAKWITADTVDNGDESILYVKPKGDKEIDLRLQINYALSGEHNYDPGDVTITVPAYIIDDRSGRNTGTLIIPYAEEPSTRNDFNWKRVGDTYVLTNTRKMSAATKGYIQFAIAELTPHTLVDCKPSEEFSAYIEVVTRAGSVIGLESNTLTAVIDTEAIVRDASKKSYSEAKRVSYTQIPADQRVDGEVEYIVVDWTAWAYTEGNTVYDLEIKDEPTDEYGCILVGNPTLVQKEYVKDSYRSGITSTYTYRTAYPASQFEPDTEYVFHNRVTFTLMEKDPDQQVAGIGPNGSDVTDPRKVTVTVADAARSYSWHRPQWIDPTGHYMVWKNGNDDTVGDYRTHKNGSVYSDENLRENGYYGIYNKALNDLRDGAPSQEIAYTVDSLGYIFPWTYETVHFSDDPEIPPTRIQANYNQHDITMVTEDTGLRLVGAGELTVGTDYDFTAIEFPYIPIIYQGVPQNINPDGSWHAVHAGDGTFRYTRDYDKSHIPDVILEIKTGGQWQEYARVSYKTGTPVITRTDGTTGGINNVLHRLDLPENVETFRTSVTGGKNPSIAGISYDVRPIVTLYNTDEMKARLEEAFEKYYTPEMIVYNGTRMTAFVDSAPDTNIVTIDKDGLDRLRGYSTDLMSIPEKSARQSLTDVDFDARRVTIHYSASVTERSFISDSVTYEEAKADGKLKTETSGIWRDLLPKGVTPVLSSVKLRSGDTIRDLYTIENYRNSGRTLLVVEADLTPVTSRIKSGDTYYYQDVIRIDFDAVYDFDSIIDYGDVIHNVISFESANDTLGTVPKYSGEYGDDPTGGGNAVSTDGSTFENQQEKEWMTGLNPHRDTPSFLFAGVRTELDLISAARTSLSKDVQTNYDGRWSSGVWGYVDANGNHIDNREEESRIVYTGGFYQYRLRMMSDAETISKDLKIFDSLENYQAVQGNDPCDIGAPHWQGTFLGVDVSQLEARGCKPVVYYSTVAGLQLADENDPEQANAVNMDLTNSAVWTRADQYEGELSAVKAIAVDASKKKDGSDFTLQPLESATFLINMQAPTGEAAEEYIAQEAHAYNNAFLLCTSVDQSTGEEDNGHFVRKDYTKVGLEEYEIRVKKTWRDGDDRDGLRPRSVTLRLYRYDEAGRQYVDAGKEPLTLEIAQGRDEGTFDHLPFCDADGNKIRYIVREDAVEGYQSAVAINGTEFTLVNIHEPEKISLSGKKTWVGDQAANRPAYIVVNLYAGETKIDSKRVYPNSDGDWKWEFTDLYKYENHGQEIVYTVREERVGNDPVSSYVPSYDGADITNTYHPYGDLSLEKRVEDVTEASRDRKFTFIITLAEENGDPLPGVFPYTVTNEGGEEIRTGSLAAGGEVWLRGGEKLTLPELPEDTRYTITEKREGGFTATDIENDSGVIRPNTVVRASFVNTYAAEGSINPEAGKTLLNRSLNRYQFIFELWRLETDEEGQEIRTLAKTASNGTPGDPVYTDDEQTTVAKSEATAVFGALTYTQADHGKTFEYILKERDREKPGYSYDKSEYKVTITPVDNGDGTMTVTARYEKIAETCGECHGSGNSGEDDCSACGGTGQHVLEEPLLLTGTEKPSFENEYKAEGELVLRAWKDLVGRPLTDGEFTFFLMDESGRTLQTKTNDAEGAVTFDALKFDEKDVGKTYYFGVREAKGSDPAVNYDENSFGYKVIVYDNGDGTLSFSQDKAVPVYKEDAPTADTVKYAVSVYGIGVDKDELNQDMGLTFGPALGGYYLNGYKAHSIDETLAVEDENRAVITGEDAGSTESGNPYRCIHYDDWESILEWNTQDPHVYEKCIANKCTHSVELTRSAPLKSTGSTTYSSGDGASLLLYELPDQWRKIVNTNAYSFNWGSSRMRAMLNGGDELTDEVSAGTDAKNLSREQSLLSWFPSMLRVAIGSRATKYDSVPGESTAENLKVTYDKLWLLSTNEVYTRVYLSYDENGSNHPMEGSQYPRFANHISTGSNYSNYTWPELTGYYLDYRNGDIGRSQSWFTRSLHGVKGGTANQILAVTSDGRVLSHGPHTINDCFAPCFTLKAETPVEREIDHWETTDAPLPVFTNTLKPGGLRVTKTVTGTGGDPDREFTFKLRLIGEEAEGKSFTFDFTRTISHPATVDVAVQYFRITKGEGVPEKIGEEQVEVPYGKPVVLRMDDDLTGCSVEERENTTLLTLGKPEGVAVLDLREILSPADGDVTVGTGQYSGNFFLLDTTKENGVDVLCDASVVLPTPGGYIQGKIEEAFAQACAIYGSNYAPQPDEYGEINIAAHGIADAEDPYLGSLNEVQWELYQIASFGEDRFYPDSDFEELFTQEQRTYLRNTNYEDFDASEFFRSGPGEQAFLEFLRENSLITPSESGRTDNNGSLSAQGIPLGIYLLRFPGQDYMDTIIYEKGFFLPAAPAMEATVLLETAVPMIPYMDERFAGLAPAGGSSEPRIETSSRTMTPGTDGTYTFTLRGGETVAINDIPAGTAYQVWEETPEGWRITEQSNVSGVIRATEIAGAGITNEYSPHIATAQFTGTKLLDNKGAEKDSFTFELLDSQGTVIQTKKVLDGGFVQFDSLEYTQAGTYTYSIREVDPEDENIDYDRHAETVTVVVTDDGAGNLSAVTTYANDGDQVLAFRNRTRPGSLEILKSVDLPTDANKDAEFTFKVTLYNEKGMPLSDDENIYWYRKDAEGNIVGNAANTNNVTPLRRMAGPDALRDPMGILGEDAAAFPKGAPMFAGTENAPLFRSPAPDAVVIESGTVGECPVDLYSDGTLVMKGNRISFHEWEGITKANIVRVECEQDITVTLTNGCGIFSGCKKLVDISGLSRWDVSGSKTLGWLFRECSALKDLSPLAGWDTGEVTSLSQAFEECRSLVDLKPLENWDTGKVTNTNHMFEYCSSLSDVSPLSGWNVAQNVNFESMFHGCKLKDVTALKDWDTSQAVTMQNMFLYTDLERADVSGWDMTRPGENYRPGFGKTLKYLKASSKTRIKSIAAHDAAGIYRSTWMLEDGSVTGLTASELTSRINEGNGAGTWVWELKPIAVFNEDDKSLKFYNSRTAETYEATDAETVYYLDVDNNGYYGQGSQAFAAKDVPWHRIRGQIETVEVVDEGIQPKNMCFWFKGCTLKSIDISKLDTSKVMRMEEAFWGAKISRLKFSEKMRFVNQGTTSAPRMFYQSEIDDLDIGTFEIKYSQSYFFTYAKVRRITVGEQYRLGKNPEMLPPIDTSRFPGYTGKWMREDDPSIAYTVEEMCAQEDTIDLAGTWVWQPDESTATVFYDAQGGVVSPSSATWHAGDDPLTLPEPERYRYVFAGWNTEADGSGTSYPAGGTYSPAVGTVVTLYAQWSRDTRSEYTVKHYRQKSDLSGYELAEREILLEAPGASVTPPVRSYTGCTTPPAQTHTVPPDDSLVISYYYDRARYTVTFDGNGATSGQMDPQEMFSEVAMALKKNVFSKLGHIFMGWQDNEGNTYTDQQVLSLRREGGSFLPLTARWLGNENEVHPTSGEIIVKCRAGETIVIPDLPAGTQYTVEEIDNPAGFTTGVIEEGKGSIVPNAVSHSTVNNRYTAEGLIAFEAHKAVEGGTPEEDKYFFELLDGDGNVLQRVTNGPADTAAETFDDEGNLIPNPWQGTASVLFDVLTFTQADIGTRTFYIREVSGDDERMNYDTHTETVTVTIADTGNGTLDVRAVYDNDGALFTNRPKTGELTLSKEILGATEGAAQTPFTFTLKLKDAAGNEIEGEFPVQIRHENYGLQTVGVDAAAYSYTENLNQDGVKQSEYGNNWGNERIRGTGRDGASPDAHVVTIPGAVRLHVKITWGGESSSWDWACMWAGDHAGYTAQGNYGTSLTDKLGGGRHTDPANTREYDVEGDTVTFSFRSDSSQSGEDGYGYYAVITSEKEEVPGGYTDTVVSSGGNLQLKGGETAVITGLPDGATYEIVESDAPGWENTEKTGNTGTIDIVEPAEAAFTNTYRAECEAVIRANKKVTGGAKLLKELYSFSLQDEEGNTLYTAYADPEEGDWPTEGVVTFPAIGYTSADAGKTFRYFIAENPGVDEATTYDSHVEGVTVTIRDDGQGGLRAEVVYDENGALFINHVEVPPLPEAGGIGTGIFYLLGAALVLLAGMLFIIRRRRANTEG